MSQIHKPYYREEEYIYEIMWNLIMCMLWNENNISCGFKAFSICIGLFFKYIISN